MKKVFTEVNSLDQKCYTKYYLSEDILMEHAASSIVNFIRNIFDNSHKIFIVAGGGNNGADTIAVARILAEDYKIKLYLPFGAKSQMAKLQLKRLQQTKVQIVSKISKADIFIDGLFGSGLNRPLDSLSKYIITKLNKSKGYKISCDIPSGIDTVGNISSVAFKSDTTITMGALKQALFSDIAKDFTGEIIVANLGISNKLYEGKTNIYLLEKTDLKLPFRLSNNTHKGNFGHLSVIIGDKEGAGIICANAASNVGVGLVTTVGDKVTFIKDTVMYSKTLPNNTTAIAVGMGLGYNKNISKYLQNTIPLVIDADMFYNKEILTILQRKNVILTPHPKEFCSLLSLCGIADVSIEQLQQNRFKFVKLFCSKYPKIVLLLKGSNVLIGHNKTIFINNFGTSSLSFGGSGDVLSGIIGGLLAQGYTSVDSAICGSLIHTLAALEYKYNNFSLDPNRLIKLIKKLQS